MTLDYDVIVVGGGGAGLTAAIRAGEEGARVLVTEAADKVGGATALSGGVFYAAGTSVQRQRGILDDTPDAMFRYYMTLNQYKLDAAMVKALCDQSAAALEWLIGLGVRFPAENLYAAGLDGALRGHRAAGLGAEIVEVLDRTASHAPNVDIAVRTRVTDLMRDEKGRIGGIVADGQLVSAGAVVLATGGFGANPEMVASLYSDGALFPDAMRYIGAPTNRGDGIAMGERHGAFVTGHNRGSLLLTPNFSRDFEPYLPAWLMFVDRDGNRFIDETMDYSVAPGAVLALPGHECFAVFDEEARLAARERTAAGDAKRIYAYSSWSGERLGQMAAEGRVASAETLEELGARAGINGAALAASARRITDDLERYGEDRAFFKDPAWLRPVGTPPFYAVRLRPSVIGTTHAGLRCSPSCEVLGRDGSPVRGLFAAGETVGNILGERYAGGGNSLANSITFGLAAGSGAAATARDRAAEAPGDGAKV